MRSKNIILKVAALLIAVIVIYGCRQKEPVDYVNPYMGNISHMLVPTFPTVHRPNSMLRIYPLRYSYSDVRVGGLPVATATHREKSAFRICPLLSKDADMADVVSYSYDNECITPYSYEVTLDESGTDVFFAPEHQSAVYRLRFNGASNVRIAIESADGVMESGDGYIQGFQNLSGSDTRMYFYAEFLQKPDSISVICYGRRSVATMHYSSGTDEVRLKYGISYIGHDQAKANLRREINDYDVERIARSGRDEWNRTLGKIMVEGSDEDAKTVFYTSLYRTYERMIDMSEDGKYFSPFDGKIHTENGFHFYNDDWIWDTYRAVHPLRVLIEPTKEVDMLRSYIEMSRQSGNMWLPTFPETTGDSRRMNCNHGIAAFADAYSKGLRGFDLAAAYEASSRALTEKTLIPWSGAPAGELDAFFKKKGYFPALRPGEKEYVQGVNPGEKRQPVAVTLGTAYDEWCLSVIAGYLGKNDEAEYFRNRSFDYRNLFNPDTGFFHPKDSSGKFIEPLDYERGGGMGARDYYDENNAWVYRWDVQHNIHDLISLMGGPDKFTKELDRMFSSPISVSRYLFYSTMPDHTGNVGQFSMGNEPSMHIPYLYCYGGVPWKTQKTIRTLLEQWFRNDLMGVCGDEDGGGLSAFAVFSSLGFYPVTPGLPAYTIGSPVFKKAVIRLGNGNTFTIKCGNYSPENKYIKSARLNGKPLPRCWLTNEEVMAGGVLDFTMSRIPEKSWGTESLPPAFEMP